MESLRMLRSLLSASVNYAPYDNRYCCSSAKHIMPVCCLINDRIHRIHHKVHSGMNNYRPHTNKGSSYCSTCYGIFRNRGVNNSLWPEFFKKTFCGISDIPWTFHTLSNKKNGSVT